MSLSKRKNDTVIDMKRIVFQFVDYKNLHKQMIHDTNASKLM